MRVIPDISGRSRFVASRRREERQRRGHLVPRSRDGRGLQRRRPATSGSPCGPPPRAEASRGRPPPASFSSPRRRSARASGATAPRSTRSAASSAGAPASQSKEDERITIQAWRRAARLQDCLRRRYRRASRILAVSFSGGPRGPERGSRRPGGGRLQAAGDEIYRFRACNLRQGHIV